MGLFSFFRRRWRDKPSAPDAFYAIDRSWATGDLAECIEDGRPWVSVRRRVPSDGPAGGEIHVVSGVRVDVAGANSEDIFLEFSRFGKASYDARFFRKIVPHADRAQAASADFLPWLRQFEREPAQ